MASPGLPGCSPAMLPPISHVTKAILLKYHFSQTSLLLIPIMALRIKSSPLSMAWKALQSLVFACSWPLFHPISLLLQPHRPLPQSPVLPGSLLPGQLAYFAHPPGLSLYVTSSRDIFQAIPSLVGPLTLPTFLSHSTSWVSLQHLPQCYALIHMFVYFLFFPLWTPWGQNPCLPTSHSFMPHQLCAYIGWGLNKRLLNKPINQPKRRESKIITTQVSVTMVTFSNTPDEPGNVFIHLKSRFIKFLKCSKPLQIPFISARTLQGKYYLSHCCILGNWVSEK